ncbi:MAG TPA: class I SAM-dependent rRNA methyltransferase [Spirochaetota bacterium]|nr:class I SAM-dependent rRNA methyltransferase [Spirochaetota bacterium]HOL58157.1 class I SAM-dependent rRNA methyltransferase [Spirochaetota bacterium]HPP05639.1 class I SAM-dependent rRNA methyltransferase [Spirochaetota bacterium]
MNKIFIKKSVLKSVTGGHPWIFSGAIDKEKSKNLKDGQLCEIWCENKFIGIGYYNSKTDIAIRILTRVKREINKDFFLNRFRILKENKEKFLYNTNAYRLVFGESDNIPGLVVDIYNNVIVIQVHTLGIELLKGYIIEALKEIFKPDMIYEKSDIGIREKEGLKKENSGVLSGNLIKYIDIVENNVKFRVNIIEGQKTGFFLDQRENRKSLQKYSENKNVLNCFCYTGGFSVYAAFNAKSVTSIDISKNAIEDAKVNFSLNGFDINKYQFISKDVFEFLQEMKKDQFDMIILDPPSFAKNKK